MGSRDERSAPVTRRIAKHGASWLYDFLASQLVGFGLTVILLALGIGYGTSGGRVAEAKFLAVSQTGGEDLARGYRSFSQEIATVKDAVVSVVPEEWRDVVKHAGITLAVSALVIGMTLALLRAPSRAHVVRDLGWGIAAPGLFAAGATVVLEWRALRAIHATLSGERSLGELSRGGRVALVDVAFVLWPALVVGGAAIALAVFLHRRHRRKRGEAFTPLHVLAHFFLVLGAVPWVHLVVSALLGAFSEGASTGASLAPWVGSPLLYMACTTLFAAGAALFLSARAEAKRVDAESD